MRGHYSLRNKPPTTPAKAGVLFEKLSKWVDFDSYTDKLRITINEFGIF